MRKGFTLVELIVVIALIAVLTGAVIGWYNEFKDKQIVDSNGDGIVYYDDITFPQPPNYREILKQHGIDVSKTSSAEVGVLGIFNEEPYYSITGPYPWQYTNENDDVFDATTDSSKLRTIVIATDQTVSDELYKWLITDGNLVKLS